MRTVLLALLGMLVATLSAVGASPSAAAPSELAIENVAEGETLRHPTLLLRGTGAGDGLVVVRRVGEEASDEVYRATAVAGRFVALVELRPGENVFSFTSADGDEIRRAVRYEPATAPHRVRLVYVTAEDRRTVYMTQRDDDPQDYEARFRTAGKLLQAFTAETMRDAGFGRRTFQLEHDEEGEVVVHTLALPEPREALLRLDGGKLWRRTSEFVPTAILRASPHDKYLVLTAFSDYDPETRATRGATALGGGSLALFSNLCLFSWPDSIADAGRAFTDATPVDTTRVSADVGLPTLHTLAATTMGACLHELGHTWGLPHTADPRCIMSRGFDHLFRCFAAVEPRGDGLVAVDPARAARWSPAFAMRLAHDPWFQPDPLEVPDTDAPTLVFDREDKVLRLHAEGGWSAVSVQAGDLEPRVTRVRNLVAEAPEDLELGLDDERAHLGVEDPLVVIAFDRTHRRIEFVESTHLDPAFFVGRWRIEKDVERWVHDVPPLPERSEVRRWTRSLGRRRPVAQDLAPDAPFRSVDLGRLFPRTYDASVRALATVQSDAKRSAVLRFGGDDGARVWVNGVLVLDRPVVAVLPIDSERVEVELEKGNNEILVQSFQGPGGWGFSLRLTDEEGKPLLPR